MIAVRNGFTLSEINLPDSPAEIIWGKVMMHDRSQLILGSYYRSNNPKFSAVDQQNDFETSLKNLKSHNLIHKNDTIILGGDFNFRDIDWETDTVPPGSEDCQPNAHHNAQRLPLATTATRAHKR